MDEAFCMSFLEREKEEREIFFMNFQKGNFPEFFYYFFFFLIFLTFFSLFHYFLYLFLPIFLHDFSLKWGVFIGDEENGRLALVYTDTLMLAFHFSHLISHFLSFSNFWPDLCAAVWRPFRAPFSLNFICMESSRCPVSNGPGLWFGATVVKILRSEGMWHIAKKFCAFFSWKIHIF